MSHQILEGYSNLIGIPYEEMNCFALAKAFYKQVLGLDLKSYHDGKSKETKESSKALIYTNLGDFYLVEIPNFGDLILLKLWGIESHIGVYLGDGLMLHSIQGTGSAIDRVTRWGKNISGYYRPKRGDT